MITVEPRNLEAPMLSSPPAMAQMLPDDILYLIVLHSLKFPVSISGTALDPLSIPPINFSAVCRSWREVVVSQPSLWSSIHIKHDLSKPLAYHPSALRFVEKLLKNSLHAPLNVRIDLFRTGEDAFYEQLLALILPHYQRWREIDICVDSFSTHVGQPVAVQCSPSAVKLRFGGAGFAQHLHPLFLDLSSCTTNVSPQLRVLDVSSGVKCFFPALREALHLPNLRDLSFSINERGSDFDDLIALLSASPNITSLCVDARDEFEHHDEPGAPFGVPHLTTLSITSSSDRSSAFHLLNHLTCPSLRSFTFHADYQIVKHEERGSNVLITHLGSFIAFFLRLGSGSNTRSLPPLTELELQYHLGTDVIPPGSYREHAEALSVLLRLFDDLERLSLSGLILDDELIEDLTLVCTNDDAARESSRRRRRSAFSLCPRLVEIKFKFEDKLELRKESVEEMILSRWKKSQAGLRAVTLRISGFENLGRESERVRACVGEGLVVRPLQPNVFQWI